MTRQRNPTCSTYIRPRGPNGMLLRIVTTIKLSSDRFFLLRVEDSPTSCFSNILHNEIRISYTELLFKETSEVLFRDIAKIVHVRAGDDFLPLLADPQCGQTLFSNGRQSVCTQRHPYWKFSSMSFRHSLSFHNIDHPLYSLFGIARLVVVGSLNESFHRLVEFSICRDTGLVEVEILVAEGLSTEESKLKDDGFYSEAVEFLVHALDHTCELN